MRMEQVLPGLATPVILTTRPLPEIELSSASAALPSLSDVNESTCAIGRQPSDLQMYSTSSRSMSRITAMPSFWRKCSERSLTASRRMLFCTSSSVQPAFLIFLHILRMYLRSSRRILSIWSYSLTTTLFSMSVLGALRQNWISPILGASMRWMPPERAKPFPKHNPSIISVSSIVPPTRVTILTSSRSTLIAVAGSITFSTASTASGANSSAYCEMTLLDSDVRAALIRESRSVRLTGVATSSSRSCACATALP
mmetsp:Transcript_126993/g.308723  ORF Transcript_126993/g.308723 Transcript_126993/m.308723 type:complete len:255 (+) Transcript_126993:580-1344(+)